MPPSDQTPIRSLPASGKTWSVIEVVPPCAKISTEDLPHQHPPTRDLSPSHKYAALVVAPRLPEHDRELVARHTADLTRAALAELEARHEWYAALTAQERASVALVADAGVKNFVGWLAQDVPAEVAGGTVFDVAPRDLTRSISLRQTLDLIRSVVDVIEDRSVALVGEEGAPLLREAMLRYSREVAFRAAHIYAGAAEQRGAWDARLEALVVDAILRGDADDAMTSRASALGWGATTRVAVIAATPPPALPGRVFEPAQVLDRLHRVAARHDLHVLAAVQGGRVICLVGNTDDALRDAATLSAEFGEGPIVVGPTVPHLFAAGRSARAAISGHAAAAAWPDAPRPVSAQNLLAERALLGDLPARNALVTRIARPLEHSAAAHLLDTAATYLESGRSLEATARRLFVHTNTVRYRLGRITDITGYDLADPHDADTVHLAIRYLRLSTRL